MPEHADVLVEQASAEIERLAKQVQTRCDPRDIFTLGITAQKYMQKGEDMGLQIWDPEMKRIMELFSHASLTAGSCQED